MHVTEETAVEHAAVECRVILARHAMEGGRINPAGDGLEELHPLRVLTRLVSIVGQVAGEEHEVGTARSLVDQSYRAFKGLGTERVGWALEADVRVAELGKSKTLRGFAVGSFEEIVDRIRFGMPRQKRCELVEYADA